MLETNPFSILSETVPLIGMQSFVIAMVALNFLEQLWMIHHKNVKYFFNNAKKQKKC